MSLQKPSMSLRHFKRTSLKTLVSPAPNAASDKETPTQGEVRKVTTAKKRKGIPPRDVTTTKKRRQSYGGPTRGKTSTRGGRGSPNKNFRNNRVSNSIKKKRDPRSDRKPARRMSQPNPVVKRTTAGATRTTAGATSTTTVNTRYERPRSASEWKKDAKVWRTKHDELEQEIEEIRQQNEDLQESLKRLDDQMREDCRSKDHSWNEERERQRKEQNRLRDKHNEELRRLREDHEREVSSLRDEKDRLREDSRTDQQQARERGEKLEREHREAVQRLEGEHRDALHRMEDDSRKKLRDAEDKLRRMEDDLKADVERAEQRVKKKEKRVKEVEQAMDELKDDHSELKRDCQSVKEERRELKAEIKILQTKQETLEGKISDIKAKLSVAQAAIDRLEGENNEKASDIQRKTVAIAGLRSDLSGAREAIASMEVSKQRAVEECQAQKAIAIAQMEEKMSVFKAELEKKMADEIALREERIRQAEERRKVLHNTIQELKGNIRVFCRVRPVLPKEKNITSCMDYPQATNEREAIEVKRSTQSSVVNGKNKGPKKWNFEFDRVFNPTASQKHVFNEISQLVQSALDGYKVCIFAYGQTGAGKTFTMEGPSPNPTNPNRGMIPRSVEQIFKHADKLKELGWQYNCRATFLEIYNERIRDLLRTRSSSKDGEQPQNLELRQLNKKNKNLLEVHGLTHKVVNSSSDVYPFLQLANQNRSVGKTSCNAQSSRSHSVFQLFIEGHNTITQQKIFGVLNLIDLAGSERLKLSQSEGQRLKEAQAINKSLASLGDVISAIGAKSKHIPYRNSTLTKLLMNYFGGDSKTLMFVNLCPDIMRSDESLCSLRFAAKVNNCQIGTAKRNVKAHR